MQTDLPAFLHLYHCFNGARRPLRRLLEVVGGDAGRLQQESLSGLCALGIERSIAKRILQRPGAEAEADLQWANEPANHLVCCLDAAYPALLREIDDPPLLLYARGDAAAAHFWSRCSHRRD